MTIKIQVQPRTVIRAKAATRIVGDIVAGTGISVVKSAGDFTISVDTTTSSIVTGPALGTDNAVPRFDGSDGTVLQNSNVLISDAGVMSVTLNAAALQPTLSGTLFQVGNADGQVSRISVDGYGSGATPNVTFRASRGTAAAPTAVQANDSLGSLTWNAYGATAYAATGRGNIQVVAAENWTDAAHGTKFEFRTTPAGSTLPAIVATIGSGGTLTLTPTANTTNKGLDITMSGPTSGSVQGSLDYNEIVVTSGVRVLGDTPSAEDPWNDRVANGLKVRLNVGANATGFQIGQMVELWHTAATNIWADGSCDFIGHCIHAYSNAADSGALGAGAGFFGGTADISAGASAVHGDFVSFNPTNRVVTGATIRNRVGVRSQGTGDSGAQGSNLDAAYTICAFTNNWKDGIVFGDDLAGFHTPVTNSLMRALFAFDVPNGFDLSNVTVTTGSILKVSSGATPAVDRAVIDWAGNGLLTQTINRTGSHAIFDNLHTGGVSSITIRNDRQSNNLIDIGVRGSARASFGALVADDPYVICNHANGLLLLNYGSGPIRFATGSGSGNTEKARVTPSGGLNVGATADTAAGVINANSGYTVGTKPMGIVLLNTLTASGSATLDDTTSITAAYDLYLIEIENIVPVTNATRLMLQFSKNAGGAWLSTGYLNSAGGATDSVWINNNAALDNTAGAGISAAFYLQGPNRTDNKKQIAATGVMLSGAAAANVSGRGWYNTDNDAVNAMRFKMDSGNISTGKIRIYGIRTS